MAIIVSQNGKNASLIDQSSFGQETDLQQYVYDNPDIIPLYQIEEDIRLFVAAREFRTKSGHIDALGFDIRGNIYVVETKLYKNPDKRTVVAQALDYGASLWRHSLDFSEFLAQLDNYAKVFSENTFKERYEAFFDIPDATENLENIKINLTEGSIKFVVLMDSLHDALKDLVVFVNQNSKFDLYAVELEYYKHKEFEIVIPKLFGAEVKKEVSAVSTNNATEWTPSTKEEYLNSVKFKSEQLMITSEIAQSLKLINELFLQLNEQTDGVAEYWHAPRRTGIDDQLLYMGASAIIKQTSTLNLYDNGKITLYFPRVDLPQSLAFKKLKGKIISEGLFQKSEADRDKAKMFLDLKTNAADTKKFIEILQAIVGEFK